jgi:glucan phosphoethanolaminetransferase (alkaline phosphatase superfamily)
VSFGALILAGLLVAGAGGARAATRTRPPIIVILTLDTTRADHLSLYGYGRPTAPALAEVANRAVAVRRAITPMPMTDPGAPATRTRPYDTRGTLRALGYVE